MIIPINISAWPIKHLVANLKSIPIIHAVEIDTVKFPHKVLVEYSYDTSRGVQHVLEWRDSHDFFNNLRRF